MVASIHTTALLFLHFFASKMLHFEHEGCCKAKNKDRKIIIKAYSGMLTTQKSRRLNRPADLRLCVTVGHELCVTVGHELCVTVGHELCVTVGHELCVTVGHELCVTVGHEFWI